MNQLMPGFSLYPKAGVIRVMEEAAQLGFSYIATDWANLGQGGPELGEIDGCLPRIDHLKIQSVQHGYAPVAGLSELRQKVAQLYNDLFRKNWVHKYSADNVLIGGGGRLALSRVIGTLGKVRLAFFNPDYASYQGIMNIFNNVEPVEFRLDEESDFSLNIDQFEKFVISQHIQALLISNPCNPTGKVIQGQQLKRLVALATKYQFSLIIDEFYFNHYYQDHDRRLISSSEFIEDVENTPVIIISGLSKAYRYPGWRLCWAIAPSKTIESISSVASFLDGGASHPIQVAALPLLTTDNLYQETVAIHHRYKAKRDYLHQQLNTMGLDHSLPAGAFYIWVNLNKLKEPINDGYIFFKECLKEKVIVVPGEYFDLRPNISLEENLYHHYIRLSFSPSLEVLKRGVAGMARVISRF